MNCKPGDLAVVVNTSEKMSPFLGRVIVVGRFFGVIDRLPCWDSAPRSFDPRDGWPVVFADNDLRPIRDPGDDARDESLEWKLVPVTVPGFTKEHA